MQHRVMHNLCIENENHTLLNMVNKCNGAVVNKIHNIYPQDMSIERKSNPKVSTITDYLQQELSFYGDRTKVYLKSIANY